MSSFVYAAHLAEPTASSLMVSFIRALVNLLLLVIPALFLTGSLKTLIGDARKALWLRGLFGGASLIFSFAGTQAIGVAESGFILSSNALFVAAMAPMILHQKNTRGVWLVILISMFGLYLLLEPRFEDTHQFGRLLCLLSGVCAATAYIMIARVGTSHSPSTIIFYFALVATLLHLFIMPFDPQPWPRTQNFWFYSIAAGLCATAAQYFMTLAYQLSPAVYNAIAGYASPVFGLLISIWIFEKSPDVKAMVGACIIIVCGCILPLWRARRFIRRGKRLTPDSLIP